MNSIYVEQLFTQREKQNTGSLQKHATTKNVSSHTALSNLTIYQTVGRGFWDTKERV